MPQPEHARAYLPNSSGCFVCGEENAAGLQTRFYIENGEVRARLTARRHHCGYENVVHGGVVAALLDECMGWAAARAIDRMCVTGELNVRYRKPVPADVELTVITRVSKAHRLIVLATGRIVDDGGVEYTRAEGKFSPLSVNQTLEVDDQLLYRGGEVRLFDALREARDGA